MAAVFHKGMLLGVPTTTAGRLVVLSSRQFQSYPSGRQKSTASLSSSQSSTAASSLKSVSEIPGPKRYPFIGASLYLTSHKDFDDQKFHVFWKSLVAEYGPIVRMDSPALPLLVAFTDPENAEVISRATMNNPIRPAFDSLKKIRLKAVDDYFEQKTGLLPENGEEWRRVRSRAQTPMMKTDNVNVFLSQMDQVSIDFMDRIAVLQKEHGEMPKDFQIELYKWALESIGTVALNRRFGCLEPNISDDSEPMKLIHIAGKMFEALNITELGLPLWKLFPTPSYRNLKKGHDEFLRITDECFRQTKAELMLEKADSEGEMTLMKKLLLTPGLSNKDVVTLVLDMLMAGIDTTSHTLGFTLYLLARNPNSQAKLQEEVDRVLGDHQGPITSKHLAQLSYLKAVVKESLRIFPLTIGSLRTLNEDVVLSGYLVPKGFNVVSLNMLMGHDERLFPRAAEFLPERWLRHQPLGPIHPYASLPFGIGTRMCIGRRIAEQELFTFLARVMQRFSVDYKYQDMDIISRLVFVPSEPLRFSFTERR